MFGYNSVRIIESDKDLTKLGLNIGVKNRRDGTDFLEALMRQFTISW